jgi:hypothetical protein
MDENASLKLKLAKALENVEELEKDVKNERAESARWQKRFSAANDAHAASEEELERVERELREEKEATQRRAEEEQMAAKERERMRVKRAWPLTQAGLQAKLERLKARVSQV